MAGMKAQTNGTFHSLSKHERDDRVKFWVERDNSVYWRSLMISALIASPLVFLAPQAFILGIILAAVLAYLNRRSFRLEMTPTHVHLKPSVLVPGLYLPYAALAEMRADQTGTAGPGTLVIKLASGHELRLTGVVEPVEAAQAFRTLKAEAEGAGRAPWPAERNAA